MSLKSGTRSRAEKAVKDVRRRTRRQHCSKGKIRLVLEGLRREGIAPNFYHSWLKEFLPPGKKRLARVTQRGRRQARSELAPI